MLHAAVCADRVGPHPMDGYPVYRGDFGCKIPYIVLTGSCRQSSIQVLATMDTSRKSAGYHSLMVDTPCRTHNDVERTDNDTFRFRCSRNMETPSASVTDSSSRRLKGNFNHKILCGEPVENGERESCYKIQTLGGDRSIVVHRRPEMKKAAKRGFCGQSLKCHNLFQLFSPCLSSSV
jgi:hypothetical protein